MSLSLLVSVHSGDCEVLAIGAAGRRHRSQPHRSTQDTSSAEPRRLCRSGHFKRKSRATFDPVTCDDLIDIMRLSLVPRLFSGEGPGHGAK